MAFADYQNCKADPEYRFESSLPYPGSESTLSNFASALLKLSPALGAWRSLNHLFNNSSKGTRAGLLDTLGKLENAARLCPNSKITRINWKVALMSNDVFDLHAMIAKSGHSVENVSRLYDCCSSQVCKSISNSLCKLDEQMCCRLIFILPVGVGIFVICNAPDVTVTASQLQACWAFCICKDIISKLRNSRRTEAITAVRMLRVHCCTF